MELLFLVNADQRGRERDQEDDQDLLRSEMRAHAARISHKRRRSESLYRLGRRNTALPTRSKLQAETTSDVDEEEDEEEEARQERTQEKTVSKVSKPRWPKEKILQHFILPVTLPKCLAAVPMSETRDTYSQLCRPIYKVMFDVFNVRNSLNGDPYQYWNHPPFFLGVASDMRSLREQSIGTESGARESTSVMKHMVAAVAALRVSLGEHKHVSDINMITIMLLALTEGRYGHKTANQLHRKIIVRFIQQRGGIAELGAFARSFITQFEYLSSLGTDVSFLSEILPSPSPPPKTALDSDSIDRLPEGFQVLARRGKLSANVVEVIQRAVIVHRATFNKSSVPRFKGYDLDSEDKYFSFVEACPELVMKTTPSSWPLPLGKLLSLTLLLYCCNDLCPITLALISKACTRRGLTAELMKCVFQRDDDGLADRQLGLDDDSGYDGEGDDDDDDGREERNQQEECLFWIWIVALNAWRGSTATTTTNNTNSKGTGADLARLGKERFQRILTGGYERGTQILDRFMRHPALDLTVSLALM